jgi:Golgi phosphoprotein 3 GPP34
MVPNADTRLDSLGEDLVLLSITPDAGRIATAQRIGFGLMGSELVRLAAAGRITIAANRIIVQDSAPCGDAELDAALDSLAQARRQLRPKNWVSHPRRGICEAYLARLAAAGAIRAEQGTMLGIFPKTRWRIADAGRLAGARARLDAIAVSGGQVDTFQAAYAGLAHAVGLGVLLYPGWANRHVRKRLEQIAKGARPAAAASPEAAATTGVTGAVLDASVEAAGQAAVHAASQAAVQAASQAAVQAAVDAATAAAVDAATAAAVAASVEAAHHAAADGGAGAHGHH